MMRWIKYILALCITAIAVNLSAQEMITAYDTKVIPPSPTSAVIKRYMGEQPALSTGSVNVSIPLYELKCHGITIPFSLRYNTSGIKVFDDPNPCGFGWALLPGVRVMRTIMGRPDEMFAFVGDDPHLPTDFTRLQRCMTDFQANQPNPNLYDAQHDIFTFSLIDRNLTYILDKSGSQMNWIGVGSSEYKVEADTVLTYITVTDPTGIEYLFGGVYESTANGNSVYKSAWMLSQITLPNGEQITFEWQSGHHNHARQQVLGGDYMCDEYTGLKPDGVIAGRVVSSMRTGNRVQTAPYYEFQHLKKVTFPGGVIDFSYGDNGSGPAIDKMSVFNGTDTIKTAQFTYGGATRPESYLLERVLLSDEGEYRFDYNPNRFNSQYTLDWWGYCNNDTTQTLVPQMRIKCVDPPGADGFFVNIGQANRSIDREKMQANILTSVTYPTGGITEFEYEPHRFNDPTLSFSQDVDSTYNHPLNEGGGLRVTTVTTRTSANDPNPIVKRYVYGEEENGLANCAATPIAETFVSMCRTFDVGLDDLWWYRMVTVGIFSNYMDYDIGQTPIWYSQVTEYSSEGKTVYQFSDFTPKNQFWKDYGVRMIQQLNKVFSKGPLKTAEYTYKTQPNNSYSLVQKQLWNYTLAYCKNPTTFYNTHITRNISQLNYSEVNAPDFNENGEAIIQVPYGDGTWSQNVPTDKDDTYLTLRYYIDITTEKYTGTSTTVYSDNGAHTTSTTVEYLDDTGIVCTKTDDSGCLKLYYPHTIGAINDMLDDSIAQSPILEAMALCNIKSVPVYTSLTYNGDSIAARNLFNHYGNSLYMPYRVMTRRSNGQAQIAGTYTYDSIGNLISRITPDGVTETYEWGYDNRYPIKFTLGGDQVSTYGYKPMVGLTSMTNPRGFTLTYAYDTRNRLNLISSGRDILQRFGYHLQGENTNAQSLTPWEGNYVYERTYLNNNETKYIDRVNHYDEIGRPILSIDVGAGGNGGDIAVATQYDSMNRSHKVWSPVPVSGSGEFVTSADIASSATSFYGDAYAFAETDYEASTRELVSAETRAGQAWHTNAKSVTRYYFTNDNSARYSCRKYSVTATEALTLVGNYAPGELVVNETTDEDNHVVIEFADRRGNKILTRRIVNSSTYADCYYVYDNFGDLRYVLPPMLSMALSTVGDSWTIATDNVARYGYYYRYDDAGMCVLRKLPGRDAIIYKYDAGHRLVAEQDGNMRKQSQWLIRFYDRYGREVISGFMNGTEDELSPMLNKVVVAYRSNNTSTYGYSFSHTLPLELSPIVKVDYYDDYSFLPYTQDADHTQFACETLIEVGPIPTTLAAGSTFTEITLPATSLLTGSLSFNLQGYAPLLSVNYYDRKGYLREIHSRNHLGGMDHEIYTTTYTGKPLSVVRRHDNGEGDSITFSLNYTYDHAERLTQLTHSLNGAEPVVLESVTYDELGRKATSVSGNLSTSYDYDVHGWLQRIENSRFVQELRYADSDMPCFNGNISAIVWGDNAGVTRQYGYAYDNLNRLTAASYIESGRDYLGDVMMDNQPDYSTSYRYDLNGNPTKVSRYGMSELYTLNDGTPMMLWGPIDDITLTYDGNRVTRADDDIEPLLNLEATGFNEQATQSNEYTWDANGNMTRDLNKGITSISYNWLNLPNTIVYADGHKEIRYYSTAGEKLRTVYQSVITTSSSSATTYARYRTTDTRDYSGDFIYLNDSIETQLTANGYITPDGEYRFYLRDYQGNNRLTYTAAGVVLERNDYYPYGGLLGEEQSLQPYKYSGKELETTNGLNLYDFHARYHDYTLPIFTTQDPLQEKHYDLSPYIYCAGNPVINVDISGQTYGDYRTSTIILINNEFYINPTRLSRYSQNQIQQINENPQNWGKNEIGYDLKVGTVVLKASDELPSMTFDGSYGATDPAKSVVTIKIETENAKSTKQPDKRFKSRQIKTISAKTAKGLGMVSLVLDGLQLAYNLLTCYWVYTDLENIEHDKLALSEAAQKVMEAASNGMIPTAYQTPEMISAIINVVYQGINPTNDYMVSLIGTQILIYNGKYNPEKMPQ